MSDTRQSVADVGSSATVETSAGASIGDATTEHKKDAAGGLSRRTRVITWILRIVVGSVFIFSGFVKLVDPWGTIFKLTDYLSAWNITMTRSWLLAAAVTLAMVEFSSGVMLLAGAFRRTTAVILTVFMTAMTVLTLYIVIANPVSDCGCFGDAVVLSNGATFVKNLVLMALVIWLLKFNHKVRGLIVPKLQWFGSLFTIAYGLVLAWYGFMVQPPVDFRPYSIGTDMVAVTEAADGDDMVFVYVKDGVEREFSADSIPGDDWKFVRRGGVSDASTRDFVITDADGVDVTSEVIEAEGPELMLVVTDPARYGESRLAEANALARQLDSLSGRFVAVIAADFPGGPEAWRRMTHAEYDVYQADDTDLKMLARGDAALVYLKDGIVTWKKSVYSLSPHLSRELAANPATLDEIKPVEHSGLMGWLTGGYLVLMLVICLCSRGLSAPHPATEPSPSPVPQNG